MWKAQRKLPAHEGCKIGRRLPSSSWGCPDLAQSSLHLRRPRVGARGTGQGATHPRSPSHLGAVSGGPRGGVAPQPPKPSSSLAQTSRQSHCLAAAENGDSEVSHRGAPQGRPGWAAGGRAAATYLLQQRDGVPAVVQTRGEAGRGGRVVVFGGLRDELGDGDLVRHPAEGGETQRGRGVSHGAGSRDRGPPGGP